MKKELKGMLENYLQCLYLNGEDEKEVEQVALTIRELKK